MEKDKETWLISIHPDKEWKGQVTGTPADFTAGALLTYLSNDCLLDLETGLLLSASETTLTNDPSRFCESHYYLSLSLSKIGAVLTLKN